MTHFWQVFRNGSMLTLGFLLLGACEPKIVERGRQDLSLKAGNIIAGQMSKADVMRRLGSPSTTSQFGKESWYYIASRKETLAFFAPKVVDQEVLRITFDDDIVDAVEYYDQAQAKDIEITERVTPTSGQELGLVEQLLGNIGKFNKRRGDSLATGGGG